MKTLLSFLLALCLVAVCSAQEHHSHRHDGSPVAPHWENARRLKIPDRPPVLQSDPEQTRISVWVPVGLVSAIVLLLSMSALRRARARQKALESN